MAKKRKYVHDLISVATKDIASSMEKHGTRRDAFKSSLSCPIIESLSRHGHSARFTRISFGGYGTDHIRIDGIIYKVSPKMIKWQRGGMSGRRRTQPFSFRISELKEYT